MDDDKKICGAKTRRGTPCQVPPMPNGRCYRHGGMSLAGVAHPNFRHGTRVKIKNLPPRMLEDAMNALNDPELASMRDDIVVLEARINDLIKRVDTGESGAAWRQLAELRRRHDYESDDKKRRMIRLEMFDIIEDGLADYDAWDEVSKMIDQRARIIQAEQRRLQVNGQMIAVDRAMAVIAQIMSSVREHVHDPVALSRIIREISRATGAGNAIDTTSVVAKKGGGSNGSTP